MFNSLDYVKVLEDVGLPRNQAETHVRILGRVIGEDMASKEDIKRLEARMATKDDLGKLEAKMATKDDLGKLEAKMATKDDLGKLEVKMTGEIGKLKTTMAFELQSLEHRMTLKLGGLMAAFLATGLTAAKLLFM